MSDRPRPMRFAIADPPYIGCSGMYPEKREVDHAELVARLMDEYPDGWLLCLHTPSLKRILALCPEDVRIGSWVKPWAVFKSSNPAYTWEPVIWRGGRKRVTRKEETVRDWISANALMGQRATGGVPGAKPQHVCFWYFQLLNAQDGDTVDDLYPGSGAVSRAWDKWRQRIA